jgi:hypothetical protein
MPSARGPGVRAAGACGSRSWPPTPAAAAAPDRPPALSLDRAKPTAALDSAAARWVADVAAAVAGVDDGTRCCDHCIAPAASTSTSDRTTARPDVRRRGPPALSAARGFPAVCANGGDGHAATVSALSRTVIRFAHPSGAGKLRTRITALPVHGLTATR